MKTDEKSKREEDALINFPSLVISRKFNLWLNLQKTVKFCFFIIEILPQINGGTHDYFFFAIGNQTSLLVRLQETQTLPHRQTSSYSLCLLQLWCRRNFSHSVKKTCNKRQAAKTNWKPQEMRQAHLIWEPKIA